MPKSLWDQIRPYYRYTGKVQDAVILRKRSVNRKSEKVMAINTIMRLVNVPGMAKYLCQKLSPSAVKEDGTCDAGTLQHYASRILKALVEAAKDDINAGRPVSKDKIRSGIQTLARELGVNASELEQFIK